LGIITHQDKTYSNRVFYVSELEVMKSITKVMVYRIKDGKQQELKMWGSQFNRNQFSEGDFIYINDIKKKPMQMPTGEINPETNKKIYKEVEGKFEFWLTKYQNITYEFE
jgi:hypothetical protein